MDDQEIFVRMETADRDYVLKHASPSPELRQRLRFGVIHQDELICPMSPEDVTELLDCLYTLSETARSKADRNHFKRILINLLETVQSEEADEEAYDRTREPAQPRHPWTESPSGGEHKPALRLKEPSLEELVRFAHKPIADLFGLTALDIFALLSSNLGTDASVTFLNSDIAPAALEGVVFLRNARRFLHALGEHGHVKATVAGNLNRAFVMQMLESLEFPEGFVEDVRRYNKVINETDVFPAHVVRIVLELAGLIRLQRNHFILTRKGKRLGRDECLVQLYVMLFLTFVNKFNMAYLDAGPECDDIQASYCYVLYVISRELGEWVTPEVMAQRVLLPMTYEFLADFPYGNRAVWLTISRIVKPLEGFGLLEVEYTRVPGAYSVQVKRVRKTPLIDQFIRFLFDRASIQDQEREQG